MMFFYSLYQNLKIVSQNIKEQEGWRETGDVPVVELKNQYEISSQNDVSTSRVPSLTYIVVGVCKIGSAISLRIS